MTNKSEIQLLKPSALLKEAAIDYRQEHFDAGEYVINGSGLFDKIIVLNAITYTVVFPFMKHDSLKSLCVF